MEEVLWLDVLDRESSRVGAQRVDDVLVQAVVGQSDDMYPSQLRLYGDAPDRLNAVDTCDYLGVSS